MPVKDLTGQTFGKLTVLRRDSSKTGGAAYWICECSCSNHTIKSIRGQRLRNGEVTDCGCEYINRRRKSIPIDTTSMVGQRFGKLRVIERDLSKPIGHGCNSYWICQCDCGNIKSVDLMSLKTEKTKSCGCLRSELVTQKNTLDLTNQRFGKLVALENTFKLSPHNSYIWKCRCDCGAIHYTSAETLQSGKINSCGCITSIGESRISQILTKNNIPFMTQKSFHDLTSDNNGKLKFDFAIFDYDDETKIIRLIEFDGEQHFKDQIKNSGWNALENYKDLHQRDLMKNQYAKNHNIPLVRIPYWERDNLSLDLILGDQYLI